MSETSAHELLDIYQKRIKMAEKGIIHPKPGVIDGARQLVSRLSAMSPNAMVRLEIEGGKTRFKAAATGDLLAEFDHTDDRDA
jgi:hypothetical protein